MPNELYFIPILAHAFQQSDVKATLADAFARISNLGQRPEYAQGFAQFQRFMAVAAQAHADSAEAFEAMASAVAAELMAELAAGTFEGTEEERQRALQLIATRPDWQKEFETLCHEMGDTGTVAVEVLVERNGRAAGTLRPTLQAPASLGGILPGHFVFALAMGRVIWEGELLERDLVWAAAFPESPMALAAATEHGAASPTREEPLLGGELVLRIYPGIESGWMVIEMTPKQRGRVVK